jgi:hypothetical protein
MPSLNKRINQFELAVLLEKASNDVDTLAKILDLGKLTKAINSFFAPEAVNAGSNAGVSDPNANTRSSF